MQIFKYQFTSGNHARKAERLLKQIAHIRQGNTITIHIAHASHVNATVNVMAELGAHTISDISEHDLRELWKVRKPGGAKDFYFDQIV